MLMLAGTDPKDIIVHGILLLFFLLIKNAESAKGAETRKKKPAVSRTDAVQLGTAQFVPTWCFMMIH